MEKRCLRYACVSSDSIADLGFECVVDSVGFGGQLHTAGDSFDRFSLLSAFSLGVGTIHPLFLALGFARETVLILVFTTPLYLWLLWVLAGGMGLLGVVLAFGAEFLLWLL